MPKSRLHASWWETYSGIDASYRQLIALEQGSDLIKQYCSGWAPGLLQTESMARAAITAVARVNAPPSEARIQKSVKIRLERQWHLFERASPPQMRFMLDESVLYRQTGGPAILLEQLRHLEEIASRPFVTIQVVPFSAGLLRAHVSLGRFDVLHNQGVVYACTESTMIPHTTIMASEVESAFYYNLFEELQARALSPKASLQCITQAADKIGAKKA